MADVLVDGVELLHLAGQEDMLRCMKERLVGNPLATGRERPSDWMRGLLLPRHLLLLHEGDYATSLSERQECWEDWLEEERVSEEDLAWQGLRAVAEGNAPELSRVLDAWRVRQH